MLFEQVDPITHSVFSSKLMLVNLMKSGIDAASTEEENMMSIYDDVKAEFGAGPAYANKSDFTTVFGYKGGQVIGEFPNKADATAAGATVTESNFDDIAFRAAQTAYHDHQAKISAEWNARVRAQYPEVNDAVFALVSAKAWQDGHSSGHGEVEIYTSDYVDFAMQVIEAAAK